MTTKFRSTAVLAAGLFALVSPAMGRASNEPVCKAIHGDLVEVRSTTQCRPGHTSCFLGEVDANHGLRGRTYFRGETAGSAPSGSPAFTPYSGTFEYATAGGTITTHETGVTSASVGVVTAHQAITAATGEYAGATGFFFVSGSNDGSRVVTTVTGQICRP
jgi:hypothetical protein